MPTRNLAIMFTDIKGFTARTSNDTRAELVSLLEEHDRLLRPVFAHFGGNVVKTIGDAFLVWYESPTDAVLCGVTVQEVLRKHNAAVDEKQRLQVRVAINVGDCEMREADLFGEAVNLASRLEGIAEAGEVWFTEAVFLTMNRHEVPTTEVGERTFKGIPNPVRVYKVIQDPKSDQIRRIGDTVEVERGVPKLDRLSRTGGAVAPRPLIAEPPRPASPRRAPMVPLAIAASIFIAGAVSAALVFPHWKHNHQIAEADRLATAGEYRRALDVSRELMRSIPDDPRAQDVTFRALDGTVPQMGSTESTMKALEWFRSEKSEAEFEPLGDRLGIIEVRAIAAAAKNGEMRNYDFDEEMGKTVYEYSKSPEVPFEAAHASFHQTGGDIIARAVLPWYALAVKNGHPMVQEVWNASVECWSEDEPGECESAVDIARDHHHDEAIAWAKKAIDEGPTGYAYLNALVVLDSFGGGAPSDAFHEALKTAFAKRDVETTRAAILAGTPDQKKLALVLLRSADAEGWGEERDNARAALEAELAK